MPIINVENACSSGSTAFWQAYWGITSGVFDMALAFGAEKVPGGPVTVTAENSPARYVGGDHMMAGYALRMTRYMEETGAPASAFAQVTVKARQNASMNPYAHRKDTYSVEDVLNSRLIADPPHALPVLSHQRGRRGGRTVRRRRFGRPRNRPQPGHTNRGGRIDLGKL